MSDGAHTQVRPYMCRGPIGAQSRAPFRKPSWKLSAAKRAACLVFGTMAQRPKGSGLKQQRDGESGPEGRRQAGPLEQCGQHHEKAGEGEQSVEQAAQHADSRLGPLEMMSKDCQR